MAVIYLGMRVRSPRGLLTLMRFGPRITRAVRERPDGLLRHEGFLLSLFPLHVGMRQYWRDFESLERWARSEPHATWWKQFLRDPAGTGFWHETYFRRGGFESVFVDVPQPLGLLACGEPVPAKGGMFSARERLGIGGAAGLAAPYAESELE